MVIFGKIFGKWKGNKRGIKNPKARNLVGQHSKLLGEIETDF